MKINKKIDILNRFNATVFKIKVSLKTKKSFNFKIVLAKLLLTSAKMLFKSYDLVEFFV